MKPEPPERIYGWLDSQLSIARHYGRIRHQDVEYVVAYDEKDQPLVRFDVLKREAKAVKQDRAKQTEQEHTQESLL